MSDEEDERTNHSHFQKMRAVHRSSPQRGKAADNLAASFTSKERRERGTEGRARIDQIKGYLPLTWAEEGGKRASTRVRLALSRHLVRSPLTIPPLSSHFG